MRSGRVALVCALLLFIGIQGGARWLDVPVAAGAVWPIRGVSAYDTVPQSLSWLHHSIDRWYGRVPLPDSASGDLPAIQELLDDSLFLSFPDSSAEPIRILGIPADTVAAEQAPVEWVYPILRQHIREAWKTSVRREMALAKCVNGNPEIHYSKSEVPKLTFRSFLFLRLHELAHFALRHIDCTEPRRPSRDQEREADCWALGQLRQLGQPGRDIIVASSEQVYTWRLGGSPNYYNSWERARYITEVCGQGFLPPPVDTVVVRDTLLMPTLTPPDLLRDTVVQPF
jgi:hypothetical protein